MQVDGGEQGGSYAEKVEWIGEVAGLHRTGCDKRGLCHGSGAPPGYTAECALADCANERAFLSGFYLAFSTWRRMCSPEHILSALPGNAYGAMRSVSVSLWKAVWSRKRSQPPAFLPVCATLFFSFVAKSSHEL